MQQPRTTESIVTLPNHEFFYTIDQVALLLSVSDTWLRKRVYFTGRMPDIMVRDKLQSINIADVDAQPEWRISHRELTRWLARRGYKVVKG